MTYSSGPRWKILDIRGGPLLVHPTGEALSAAIERNGDFWEANILDYLAQNYPYHTRIIDAGANMGNHTVYFGRYLRYNEIITFEPDYDNQVLLINNIAFNKIKGTRSILGALSNENGEIFLQRNNGNSGAHEVHLSGGDYLVNRYKLDYFKFDQISLLKIDAEWHEPEVLEGAQETLNRCKPLILIEDSLNVYQILLPQYQLIQEWPEHKTYLYEWRD
jgi:FkbM family methyltransferase